MVVVIGCELLNIIDNFNFKFFFFNILNTNLVLSGFGQLARHWKEGNAAKLVLACKDGNL